MNNNGQAGKGIDGTVQFNFRGEGEKKITSSFLTRRSFFKSRRTRIEKWGFGGISQKKTRKEI